MKPQRSFVSLRMTQESVTLSDSEESLEIAKRLKKAQSTKTCEGYLLE